MPEPWLLFVGEKRSLTAIARGWTWKDGHLAAHTLQEALTLLGLTYGKEYRCENLLGDNGVCSPVAVQRILRHRRRGGEVVALGRLVSHVLDTQKIPHTHMIHPATRGRMRQQARYRAHVALTLGPLILARGA